MAQDGEKMSESQHPSEEPNAEAERLLEKAASGYSGSTEVYFEPQRSSYSPITQQGSTSATSGTPTPPPPLSETCSNKMVPRGDDCSSKRLAGPSNAKNQVREITGDTSQGTVPVVRRNTAHHFAKPKGGNKVTEKPLYLTKAGGMDTSSDVRQWYENIDRNTTRGGNHQSGTKCSATDIGILPSPTMSSRDAEVQAPSAAFNALGQNVRPSDEQQMLLHPSAALANTPVNDQQANLVSDLLDAIWRATQGSAETQSGHVPSQLPHAPEAESSQFDALVAFHNKAHEGTPAAPTAYQSHLRTSNPNSPPLRKTYNVTLPQETPSTTHQQRNLPLPSLIPILEPYNPGILSTSPYQTFPSAPNPASFLLPGQINQVRHPQITNHEAPPAMQQRSFNLLQGTSSVGRDFRQQQNPDLTRTTVALNNNPAMADSGLYTSSTFLNTLGLRPAAQGNQFVQQPMPAYSAASHGYMMANTAPQIRPYVPFPQTVTQGAATQLAGNMTSQLDVARPCDRRTDPRTAHSVVPYQAVPPPAHFGTQPTLLPLMQGLQTQMPLAPRPPPPRVLYEQPVPHREKMAYVQKWLDDCSQVDPREIEDLFDYHQADTRERPSRAARQRQRAPRGRKGAPNDRSQPVLQNEEEQRDTEADATGATMTTPNVQRTVIPEETQEGHSDEPVVGAPQLRSTAYCVRGRERRLPGPLLQHRSEKTRGAMPGRQRGRKRGGRRGAPRVESHATTQVDPYVSPQPVSMESFQRQYRGGGRYLHGRRGASTSRGNLPSKGGSATSRTSAQALRPREQTSETHILESSPFAPSQLSLLPRTSSTTGQTEPFRLPPMAEQVAEREEEQKLDEVRRDLESPPRDPQRDAHSRLPYSVEAEQHWDITQETRRSSHGSEPSKRKSSAKGSSPSSPQTPRRRKGIPTKWRSTREPEDALESHNSPLPAQPGTSSLGQDHAVHKTEGPSPERRNDADETSPEQGRCRVFEPSEPSLFERATHVVSDGDSELDFSLQAPLHISPRNLSSPHDFPAPPKCASFSPWSHSRIGPSKYYAVCAPSCEDAQKFKWPTGISFTIASDTSLLDPESIEGIFRLPHRSEEFGVSCASDDADR